MNSTKKWFIIKDIVYYYLKFNATPGAGQEGIEK